MNNCKISTAYNSTHLFFSHMSLYVDQLDGALLPAAAAKSLQSCPTLYDPIDGSPPGSPVPGILQARTLVRCKYGLHASTLEPCSSLSRPQAHSRASCMRGLKHHPCSSRLSPGQSWPSPTSIALEVYSINFTVRPCQV